MSITITTCFTNTDWNQTASWYGFGGHLDFNMWLVPRAGFPVQTALPCR